MKNRNTDAVKGFESILFSPLKISPGKILLSVDLDIFLPFRVSILACIQYFTGDTPLVASAWAISHSWCGNFKSIPPP